MTDKYSVTTFASSEQPKDWGRALADAVSQLVELITGEDVPGHEGVHGKDFRLRILPNQEEEGVDITVSWDPAAAADAPA